MHSLVTYFDFYFQFLVIFKNGLVQNYDHDQKVRKQLRNLKYNCYHKRNINGIYKEQLY